MTLKKRQRSVDPNNSINSRQAKRQKKECSIKDNNTTISIAAEQTWRSILEMRKKPTLEQRDNSFKRFLNKTYGCVPNLPQILENHLRPAYIDNDIPNMYPYIKKIINLTQLCISKYGFKHQCTDHSTYSPNKFLENKTAHLRDYAKSLLLSHISGGQPVQLDNEEEGFNKLLSVMELLKEGRIQTAIADITPYWTTADCDTILQHGIATHVKQRELPEKGLQALVKRFACLVRSGIHQRFGAIDLAQDSIPNVRTVHHTEVDPARPIWDDALYDPDFVNPWFTYLNEPYKLLDKIVVHSNQHSVKRQTHKAYLLCYRNSLQTRRLMYKTYCDDYLYLDNTYDEPEYDTDNKIRRFSDPTKPMPPPREAIKPINFQQLTSGPCCSMALFNYVANKNPSSTTQSILNDIQSDITPGSLQKNLLLQCLHQHILRSVQPCTDKPTAIINGDNDNGCDNTLQTSSDNHIVLIMPYKGHVWEIDSLQSDPVYLGLEGDDWTEVAQQRLESWTSAAYHTKVHNDIHPIVLDKTTFLR